METLIFLGLLSFTWLFVEGAKPIQFTKKLLHIHEENNPRSLTRKVIKSLVNCSLCTGFWVGLSYYGLTVHSHWFLMACLTSICAELFHRIINFLFNHLFNHL